MLVTIFRYKRRVARALADVNSPKPSILSMIIDGMDQSHCRVPYLGTQCSFSSPLKQCITGVKEHGRGITMYRTIDTVKKGSDLTIYCVLSQIEQWKMRNGYYPEEIYLQVDGGSENANQYLLAMLEVLVVKRMCRLIYYTRLPTGHTHEDIDACFALIWICFRNRPCETLQGYKKIIEEKLAESVLHAKVVDVYVIPNWHSFFDNCIDTKLSKLHHDIQTQHQWRFQAVESVNFPLGCKTTYKAYSSDRVVELIKKPKQQCITEIGQRTGLEATTLFCPWYPAAYGINSDPRRQGIEGFYLLRRMPHVAAGTLPPCPFPSTALDAISATLKEIREKYSIIDHADIRNSWDAWAAAWAPTSNCSVEYVARIKRQQLPYHIPLKRILLCDRTTLCANWSTTLAPASIDTSFQWPEVFALAMNSVVSEFNTHAPDPRLYSTNDALLENDILLFSEKSTGFYEATLKSLANTAITSILKRKLSYSGQIKQTAGISIVYAKKYNLSFKLLIQALLKLYWQKSVRMQTYTS